jgi:hypothetical protein
VAMVREQRMTVCTLRTQFSWRIWPGARPIDGVCECGDPQCPYGEPHPFAFPDGTGELTEEARASLAWDAWPNAVPLLIAGDRLELVGVEIDDALLVLDTVSERGEKLGPVVMSHATAVFLVAACEFHHWNRYAGYGRGLRILPWVQLPAEPSDPHVRWQVPPTSANAAPLPGFVELSSAFAKALARARPS